MNSNNIRHTQLLALVVSLGLTGGSTAVYAGSIADTYATDDTLTATMMTNIKTAVNGNATDIGNNSTSIGNNSTSIGNNSTSIGNNTSASGANTTAITALQGGVPGSSCAGNPAVAGDTMVRVGSICMDKYEAAIVGGVAQSVLGATVANVDWSAAADACAQAGKRLPTNAEWQTAAAGTPTSVNSGTGCNGRGIVDAAGANGADCQSSFGVEDMVGNVSEWVADWDGGAGSFSVLTAAVAINRGGAFDAGATASIQMLFAAQQPVWTTIDNGGTGLIGFRCVR